MHLEVFWKTLILLTIHIKACFKSTLLGHTPLTLHRMQKLLLLIWLENGSIGGTFGVFLGLSFVSLVDELADWILWLKKAWCKKWKLLLTSLSILFNSIYCILLFAFSSFASCRYLNCCTINECHVSFPFYECSCIMASKYKVTTDNFWVNTYLTFMKPVTFWSLDQKQ